MLFSKITNIKMKWNDVHPYIGNNMALYFHPLGDGGRKREAGPLFELPWVSEWVCVNGSRSQWVSQREKKKSLNKHEYKYNFPGLPQQKNKQCNCRTPGKHVHQHSKHRSFRPEKQDIHPTLQEDTHTFHLWKWLLQPACLLKEAEHAGPFCVYPTPW